MRNYSSDQRGVLIASAAALAFIAAVAAAGYAGLPADAFGLNDDLDAGERIAFALKADTFMFLWLAGCVKAVSGGRFRSPADIAGSAFSAPSRAIAVRVAVLQNSLEQTVLALGAHLALATVLRSGELVAVPVLVMLFLVGRIAFAAGYADGAPARAFGMAVTAAPTLAAYIIAVVFMVLR